MNNKLYVKFKKIISENLKFIIIFPILIFIIFYEFPYYISAPGGISNVAKRIHMENANEVKGSFNLTYVSEYKATLPVLIFANLMKDWDIEKKEDVLAENQTSNELEFMEKVLLKEAAQNAVIYAYEKAGKEVEITNRQVIVNYVFSNANTDLKTGDELISINDKKITSKLMLQNEIQKYKKNDKIIFKVKHNNNKEYERFAYITELEERKLVGIYISELIDFKVDPDIKITFDSAESGPSGGLMTALAIYNYLIEDDITNGLKIAGTGTLDLEGNVGAIGGVKYKILGANKDKVKYFIIPTDNYEEAKKIIEERDLDIKLYPVNTFDETLEILKEIK